MMEKKRSVALIIFGIIIFVLIVLLIYFNINSNRLKVGMSKEEVAKILGIKDSKIMEGGIQATLLPSKKLQIIYYSRDKLEGKNPKERENILKKTLILCFENEKLVMWGYGRDEFYEIMKKYPELADLLVPGGRKAVTSPVPK